MKKGRQRPKNAAGLFPVLIVAGIDLHGCWSFHDKLSSKSPVVLPVEVSRRLDIKPGDLLEMK